MSKIKNNGGLDQYGAEPFEQQQFGTAALKGLNRVNSVPYQSAYEIKQALDRVYLTRVQAVCEANLRSDA